MIFDGIIRFYYEFIFFFLIYLLFFILIILFIHSFFRKLFPRNGGRWKLFFLLQNDILYFMDFYDILRIKFNSINKNKYSFFYIIWELEKLDFFIDINLN